MLITVVVPLKDPGEVLRQNLGSFDEQTLPPDRWEVVYVNGGSSTRTSSDQTADRLRRIENHRPNVRVVTVGETDGWGALVDSGVAAAAGDWVVAVDVEDRLGPDALSRLAAALDEPSTSGADVVVGRSVDPGRSGVEELVFSGDGATRLTGPALQLGLLAPFVLYRRSFLQRLGLSYTAVGAGFQRVRYATTVAAGSPTVVARSDVPFLIGRGLAERVDPAAWTEAATALLSANAPAVPGGAEVIARAAAVGALAAGSPQWLSDVAGPGLRAAAAPPVAEWPRDRVLLTLLGGGQDDLADRTVRAWSTATVSVSESEVGWRDGALHVRAGGRVPIEAGLLSELGAAGADLGAWAAACRARLGLRNSGTTSVYPLPATATVRLADDGLQVEVAGAVDPLTFAPTTSDRGRPLPPAAYQVVVEVLGLGWGAVPQSPVPTDVDLPAVLDGLLVSARGIGNTGLHLDVGPVRRSLLGTLAPDQVSFSEDAAGTLMTVDLADLERRGTARVAGHVLVGNWALPGHLIVDDRPRVECFVSGLPGRDRMSTRFGSAAASSSGHDLVISAVGGFRLEPSPSPAGTTPSKKSSRAPRPPRAGTLATVRRSIPEPLEPLVGRLARQQWAARLYRRLTH